MRSAEGGRGRGQEPESANGKSPTPIALKTSVLNLNYSHQTVEMVPAQSQRINHYINLSA
jgi:hypothetical protein